MQELFNVVRGVANSVAPHLRALGGNESQPVAFLGLNSLRVASTSVSPKNSNAKACLLAGCASIISLTLLGFS